MYAATPRISINNAKHAHSLTIIVILAPHLIPRPPQILGTALKTDSKVGNTYKSHILSLTAVYDEGFLFFSHLQDKQYAQPFQHFLYSVSPRLNPPMGVYLPRIRSISASTYSTFHVGLPLASSGVKMFLIP